MVGVFVLERGLGLQTEGGGSSCCGGFGLVVQLEPLLQKDVDGSIDQVFHHVAGLSDDLKGVLINCRAAAVGEGGSGSGDGFPAMDGGTGDLNCLARVGIGNRSDLRFNLDGIANAEVGATI